jgi:hypothetical protein
VAARRSSELIRRLIDQLYFSMIEIGQHGKQAMKEIDDGLTRQ